MKEALSNHLRNTIKLEVPESVKPAVEQTPVVPSGFDFDNWFNSVRDLMNQIKEEYPDMPEEIVNAGPKVL